MSLQTTYREEIRPKLVKELGVGSIMAVPRVEKVVVDMGVGEGARSRELVEGLSRDIASITGQKPQIRRAKKAVSGFGTRAGDAIGLRITLRGTRMYDFVEKLTKIVLPRVRDFRGVSRSSFDGRGNYSLGFTDHTIFPEVDTGSVRPWGMGITIVTTARSDGDAQKLLEELGMPFGKGEGYVDNSKRS